MDIEKLRQYVESNNIEWRKHALERMLQRNITRKQVIQALLRGEILELYPNDRPFESALFFDESDEAIHVVASMDEVDMVAYVITAYIPDSSKFQEDNKNRREK